ncbi:MAG: Vi polysaccharide biosynthesis protein VipB/TviC [Omnitrophica bacterium RIFCSPLOWO2_01_FULL_45_10]|nr:MAG: Vi polysaccharide biosynthesis protein VipB/TviC [Omnitrophica bacterium RIFCSPLOWO2_01_FULL_45_10]
MPLYLVTGGAGFIGSNIVEELVRRGEKVRVLDNFITGKRENIEPFLDRIELIEGDIRDKNALNEALKGVDFVLHQAALRSVAKSVEDPFSTNDVNIFGTLNLLVAAKEHKVKRVVYASSSSVYGDTKKFPQKETDLTKPISPYGVSKLAAENYCVTFAKTFGLETVSLRYFNVFGPRQNPESKYSAVIPIFIFKMLKGEAPVVEWDGKQSRDFTYVANVVKANLKACIVPGISGEVFNIACGSTTSVIDIVNILNKTLKTNIRPEYAPKRPGDVRKSYADIQKMKRILAIDKIIQFKIGIHHTARWFIEDR